MKHSRYDDDEGWPPLAWYEWVVMVVAGVFMVAFVGLAMWLSWKAVFG